MHFFKNLVESIHIFETTRFLI